MKKVFWPLLGLVLVALLALMLWPRHEAAAEFALQDLNGQTVGTAQMQNKVTLLNFWYPSCPGCVSEMPKLIKMAHDYQHKADFQIIGIALPYDPESSVRNYVRSRQIPFAVAIDADGSVGKAYQVQLAPMSFLIDAQGRVHKTYLGEPDFALLYQQVDALLGNL